MFFSFKNDPYIAVIGDIKESKRIENRSEVQKKLKQVLEEINEKYINDISSKFMITLGDEFQGLLCNGSNIMDIISEIERKMYPVKIRFGIGVGTITTDVNKEMSVGADGPAYYKARNAIETLKDNENKKQTNAADIRIEVEGDNQAITIMINTILLLLTVIKESWSDRQREIIWDMLKHQDSQINVAKRFKIKQPAVQKSLSKGKYYAYKDALDTIVKALAEIRR
ncbi:SatD family protein [Sedimentibacter sp. MB31-C6]|uniref:SatD family protein n=1 Tax=Sedimentibacter sp. MB31-C6 TaxID=3109366 RepID=UPI002DDCD253|nr:SatD family protein [Sedimentibacter sp. MB36-C1]WSI04606.1 SatD family protein [Sedimentibacter sp. MB36-C1]